MSEMMSEAVKAMTLSEMLRWCHDPDCSPNEQFEDINDWFYRETGNLRPGKSDIRGIPEKTRLQSWDKWLLEKQRAYRAGLLAIAAVEREAQQPVVAQVDEIDRCAICGWTLADSLEKGCIRGNCSMRPFPDNFYSPQRAKEEYKDHLDKDERVQRVQREQREQPADAAPALTTHCGHPASSIAGSDEGKSYCRDCAREADAMALAEAVLTSAGDSDENIWQEDHEDIIKLARKVAGR